jgi:hypothetical protein
MLYMEDCLELCRFFMTIFWQTKSNLWGIGPKYSEKVIKIVKLILNN